MRLQIGIKSFLIATSIAVASLCPLRDARAFVYAPTFSYTLHYFSDVDGLNVVTQYGAAETRFQGQVDLAFQWAHDIVVFPAIEAPPGSQDAVDAITTASRPIGSNTDPYTDFVKIRNEIQASAAYGSGRVGYYVSKESDYFAQMVNANYVQGFLDDNFTLSVGASYSWDKIDPLQDNDTSTIPDYRRTWHWNVVATQILTPTTVVRAGGEFNYVKGLQHDPYRNVYVAGTNVPESHPNTRNRRDAFLNLSQYITNRSSIKLDYRFYDDDWGITSHTFGGRLSQYVGDEFVVSYRYRYYTQIPAFFFLDDYTTPGGVSGYQTGDYRLGDYGAHLFGGQIVWRPYRMVGSIGLLSRAQVMLSYERYFNSNNFSANVFETGLRVTF